MFDETHFSRSGASPPSGEVPSGFKKCSKCGQVKVLAEFHFKNGAHTARRADCWACKQPVDRVYAAKRIRPNVYYYNPVRSLYKGAKGRGKDFNLTVEYLEKLWVDTDGRCALSGIPFSSEQPLSVRGQGKDPFRPSLDRIDNRKGYVIGNVRFILCALNIGMNEFELEVYTKIAQAVLAQQQTPA